MSWNTAESDRSSNHSSSSRSPRAPGALRVLSDSDSDSLRCLSPILAFEGVVVVVLVLVPFGTGGRCGGCDANEAAAVAVGLLLEVTNRRTALFQVLSFLSLSFWTDFGHATSNSTQLS